MSRTRSLVEQALESGALQKLPIGALESLWARRAEKDIAKEIYLPFACREKSGPVTIGIGGATLGGSFKTPLSIAIATLLAESGMRVALVGHGYRARTREARFVAHHDDVEVVGDEALMCARAAVRVGKPFWVVVGPTRGSIVDFLAPQSFDAWIFDGILQAAPTRFTHALLAADALEPFGNGRHPPAGTLRAPIATLLHHADARVAIGETESPLMPHERGFTAQPRSRGIWLRGELHPFSEFHNRRIGLLTSIARPARVRSFLDAHGIQPHAHRHVGDHGRFDREALIELGRNEQIDLWLATSKCVTKLPKRLESAEVAEIDFSVDCSEGLARYLTSSFTTFRGVARQSAPENPVEKEDRRLDRVPGTQLSSGGLPGRENAYASSS